MPIYEYQCDKCEHKFEVIQKINDDPLKCCPDCGKQSLRKLVSAAAFRLSGSGWYETDFKDKKQQKNLSKSDNKPKGEGDSKKSGSDDSSAAKKTEKSPSTGTTAEKTTKTSSASKSSTKD